jgi:hypothetical protein
MSQPPAAVDCELIGEGLLGQPVNSIGSLAFVLVGLVLLRRRPVLGWAGIAVGLGSLAFHGPMPGWAEWAHDVALAALPVALAFEARPRVVVAIVGAIAVVFGLWLVVAEVVTAILVIETGVLLFARRKTVHTGLGILAAALLALGVLMAALSRTDGPLCDPDSVFQWHALWHVLGAAALWVWARATQKQPVASN